MTEPEVVRALAALAQDSRLRAFRALVVAGKAGLTPGELALQLAVAPNTLSFHLKELSRAGLIEVERHGRNLIYRTAIDRMNQLLAYLTDNCCEGAACLSPVATRCDC